MATCAVSDILVTVEVTLTHMAAHCILRFSRSFDAALLNGAYWSHLKHLKKHKRTQTDEDLDVERIFYIKQYCEVCFVWCAHTVYLV